MLAFGETGVLKPAPAACDVLHRGARALFHLPPNASVFSALSCCFQRTAVVLRSVFADKRDLR